MGPTRRSGTSLSQEESYPAVLHRLCKEEDVLIIPLFVTHFTAKQLESLSPRRSKEPLKRDSASLNFSDYRREDTLLDEDGPPPQVAICYEYPEAKENPISIICKNMYIEFTFINAIRKSLKLFNSVNTLKIENCCISKELVELLAELLTEEPGITDLSLDGNEGLGKVFPLLLSSTHLEHLSLQRCSLKDEDINLLSENLGFSDEKTHKLKTLNLSMNRIGDLGAEYLAKALRTNRTLISLSLAGNQITDEGALFLIEALMKFKLTYDEVIVKRRRIFSQIFRKKKALEKLLQERKEKSENPFSSKISSKSGDKYVTTIKKVRGPDGRTKCIATREKRVKSGQQVLSNSGEKFQKSELDKSLSSGEPSPMELAMLEQQVENENPPDMHPFVSEIELCQDGYYCNGCWSLGNLNLAYNLITLKSVEKFLELFNYQKLNFQPPKNGLHRLVLKNQKSWDQSETVESLENKFLRKNKKESGPEDSGNKNVEEEKAKTNDLKKDLQRENIKI